ncbi:MAG TPA: TolC family protein [Candidatus Hydrogenedentes bacterium]|nr:TolC family protein [Candidatus Hydrogenedentota bacterium]HPC17667.1 TolC family protein [Candidatus Hydrogenedentota bacterium]HRT21292.1 TolC family protein [Candidatus Hydrogenedentota bacterium]HRT65507.1 TolC family protein [Candidatus Hydrogenedentota bacterium]
MIGMWCILLAGWLSAAAASGSDTTVQPLSVDAQSLSAPEETASISGKIDFNLIDLDRLREITEEAEGANIVRMSLQECIQIAIERNPDLQVVRYEPLKSGADILTAKGMFDPLLSTQISYAESLQAASAETRTIGLLFFLFRRSSDIEMRNMLSKTSVTGRLHTGTIYDVSLALNSDASSFNKFRTQWSGGLTLTLSQPLLRGRGSAVNTARIRMAENAKKIAESQLRLAVMTAVAEVVKAYWDLVGTLENVTVREQALANAERLLEISRKRLDIGTAAAMEVLQAKAGVAMRQTDLVNARAQVKNAEDAIKAVLNMRDGDIFSSARIVPVDRPHAGEFDPELLKNENEKVSESIELALKNRPEMTSGDLEIKTAEIERRRAANDMLPDVSVSGSVFQGRRGYEWDNVFSGIIHRDDHSFMVGMKASVPLGNRAARGAFQRADLTVRQAGQKLEKTKQELMLRVRLAARAVQTSQILIESNRQAKQLQEANVIAEEKRLRLGVSTSYRVLQVQQDLTLAQTQELQARIAYEKALVELRLSEGTLLESLGIDFCPPEPEAPVTFGRSIRPPVPEMK